MLSTFSPQLYPRYTPVILAPYPSYTPLAKSLAKWLGGLRPYKWHLDWYGRMGGFYILVLGDRMDNTNAWIYNRSPGLIFVDLRSIFQAGAAGNSPGPNFGRKSAQRPAKTQSQILSVPIYVLSLQWSADTSGPVNRCAARVRRAELGAGGADAPRRCGPGAPGRWQNG